MQSRRHLADGKNPFFLILSPAKIAKLPCFYPTDSFLSRPLMILFYRLVFIPALVLALPYYLWRMFRRGGYKRDFGHRFGKIGPLPAKRAGVQRLWIQAVSVGEVRAIAPLLEALAKDPAFEIVLTTTTSTGYAIVCEKYASLCIATGIFPLDFWPFSAMAWRRIRPDRVLLMEGELWPEHLHQAKKRGVPANLINARLSDRSLRRYLKVKPLATRLLGKLESVLAGSVLDAERFIALGYPRERVQVIGNLKFDVHLPAVGDAAERQHQRSLLGFGPGATVLLGSSTWPGEEALLIGVMEEARRQGIDCRLLLVPRHAERRSEVRQLLNRYRQYSHQFRSERKEVSAVANDTVADANRAITDTANAAANKAVANAATTDAGLPQLDIYVADTTGELAWLTQLADLAFIGKSLPPHTEGQSPIEAAAAGLPIVYGPGMSNFRPVCRSLAEAQAAIATKDAGDTSTHLLHLLANPQARQQLSAHCESWLKANQGATERTLQWLRTTGH